MHSIRHTQEQLYVSPKIGYVDCDAEFRTDTERLHLWATFSGDIHASPRSNQSHKLTVTSKFLSSNSKHDFCYTMAKISPSHVQQRALLSPLSQNFKSFTYFFPYYETFSINVNSLFHAAIKNLHVKANGIFVVLLLGNLTIASDPAKHQDVNRVFGFHHYRYILGRGASERLFWKFTIWSWQNFW